MENYWTSIEVNENMCNEVIEELVLSYNPCLQHFIVKSGALENVQRLYLMQLPEFVSFESEASTFYNTTWVEFAGRK